MLKVSRIICCVIIVFAVAIACEGPSGSEGSQGPEGPEGPVGPAGEDGSMMYSGEGEPDGSIGDIDDYYLNQNTGELYGPKNEDGWGNPIIVLMGEDGQDGSQIYSGNGAPDASVGVEGDYYLDKDSYELYGPKTSNGWGTPLNLKGADGNANVTRYIFPGHNFETSFVAQLLIRGVSSDEEMRQNTWLSYLVDNGDYFHVPGPIGPNGDLYGVEHKWSTPSLAALIQIILREGTGDTFSQIEVVRIEVTNTEDMTKQKDSIIPDHLDTSNYQAIAEYYGFNK